jgi:hypothetical protein
MHSLDLFYDPIQTLRPWASLKTTYFWRLPMGTLPMLSGVYVPNAKGLIWDVINYYDPK